MNSDVIMWLYNDDFQNGVSWNKVLFVVALKCCTIMHVMKMKYMSKLLMWWVLFPESVMRVLLIEV